MKDAVAACVLLLTAASLQALKYKYLAVTENFTVEE